ncbi:hypothetical protein C5F59_000075 [Streptomyces sp. QL37]|uniref:hypothetical protein n=1 Tax=Streptomyces sp. QL37 TaxID=2093747 RepID=UPI001C9E5D76|nr:hypothetical protein [Streptomyces sp. QL37]
MPAALRPGEKHTAGRQIDFHDDDGNLLELVIDTVYSFEDAIKAYEHLVRGAFGKIVIRIAG